MCDFQREQRLEHVKRWRVGWKATSGKTRTGWHYLIRVREDKVMTSHNRRPIGWLKSTKLAHYNTDKPELHNTAGFYLYLAKADAIAFAEKEKQVVQRVLYKGQCVYGMSSYRLELGVRAEKVLFKKGREIIEPRRRRK